MIADSGPRDLPQGGGFSVPHVSCIRAARLFLTQLEAAEARVAVLGRQPEQVCPVGVEVGGKELTVKGHDGLHIRIFRNDTPLVLGAFLPYADGI